MRLTPAQGAVLLICGNELPQVARSPGGIQARIRHGHDMLVSISGKDFGYDLQAWHDWHKVSRDGEYTWASNVVLPRVMQHALASDEWHEAVRQLQEIAAQRAQRRKRRRKRAIQGSDNAHEQAETRLACAQPAEEATGMIVGIQAGCVVIELATGERVLCRGGKRLHRILGFMTLPVGRRATIRYTRGAGQTPLIIEVLKD